MNISEGLYRIGREAPLTPEDRNTVLEAACEITILQNRLSETREDLAEAFRHCDDYSRLLRDHLKKVTEIYGD